MTTKEFFTTGEAVRLVNVVTRSTISRHFDRGVLWGMKNPITGQRLISRESLMAYMKQYGLSLDALPLEKKKVLLGTSDDDLFSLVQKVFPVEDGVEIHRMVSGGEILTRCSKIGPDLLILDEWLSDISISEVIRALRRTEDQRPLKIVCCMRTQDARRCLEWGADETLTGDDLNQEALVKKIHALLDVSTERPTRQGKQYFPHQRQFPRMALSLPVKIQVYLVRAPYVRQTGTGTLENISRRGAYLSGIRLERGAIPCEPFRLQLEVDRDPLKDWRANCKVLRLQSNGTLTAGVQFTRIPKSSLEIVQGLIGQ